MISESRLSALSAIHSELAHLLAITSQRSLSAISSQLAPLSATTSQLTLTALSALSPQLALTAHSNEIITIHFFMRFIRLTSADAFLKHNTRMFQAILLFNSQPSEKLRND